MTKKILITGKNSYIGSMFIQWVDQWPDDYQVDEISVHGDKWKQSDFGSYDSIIHVAGIVHTKETKENIGLFYKVNRDLAFEVAQKAKKDGVEQFVFMSTMNVYGIKSGIITENNPCNPKTAYGKSKLEAEKLIRKLQDDNFNVAIIRPPMVYGPNTVGNYVKLSKFSKITPVFPKIENKRSMIYIDNLTEFIRLLIENSKSGIYFPQNNEYVSTQNLVKNVSKINNRSIYFTRVLNPLIRTLKNLSIVEKVFGDLVYDQQLSYIYNVNDNPLNYEVVDFVESVRRSENGK